MLLVAATATIKVTRPGEMLDAGETEVDGLPARWFVHRHISSAEDRVVRSLAYVVLNKGVVYTITFGCPDSEFSANRDLFTKIKDSFQFQPQY